MPLFQTHRQGLVTVEQTNFASEKALQKLIEQNLKPVFNCRLIASEFPTGAQHSGRVDTLALSEDNNPVIIEYKKVESSELITQSLFYLHWVQDHRGDFEVAAKKALGSKLNVDWSGVRVICLAPNYKKYDLHAVQVMGANIELWQYRLFKNDCIYLEEVFQKSVSLPETPAVEGKNPVMVAAGKKAAQTAKTGNYTFEEHVKGKSDEIQQIARAVQEFVLGLDASIQEVPKKLYVAYKLSQNIVCMEVQKKRVVLYLKLAPQEFKPLPPFARDVTEIDHWGTGDFELSLKSTNDLKMVKTLIQQAYDKLGG